jgi:uncharacterized cupin superfamily protein
MKTKFNISFFLALLVASLSGTQLVAQDTASIIRYEPNGPGGKGLVGPDAKESGTGDKKTTVFFYYRSRGPSQDASGIWEAVNYRTPLEATKESEFIHVIRGSLTLGYKDGREQTFQAGDNLLIPRGAEVAWKGTQNLREYWVTFDSTGPAPKGSPAVIKFEHDGPAGKGLKPTPPRDPWPAKEHNYYSSATGSSAGVWETEAHAEQKFDKPNYCELMVFLDGEVTLSTPDGKSQTFKAGDVALVPKGATYKWTSGRLRKFWVIFDHDPASVTSSN